jgi:hypothetical protein
LPSTLETRFEPGDGSGRMIIRLELRPAADSGIVRLIGDDPHGLAQLWDEVKAAGGVALPRLDPRSYGDIRLAVISAGVFPSSGPFPVGVQYAYEFTNSRLVEATAQGPDADLVVEVLAWDKYRCESVETISVLGAMEGR